MRTLRISENINHTDDEVMKYVIGALQRKLPRAPQHFNPALVFVHHVTLLSFLISTLFHYLQGEISIRSCSFIKQKLVLPFQSSTRF